MKKVGFQYSKVKEGFVDGHEHPDVTADHRKFIALLKDLETMGGELKAAFEGNTFPLRCLL